jgi:hypothetical protein
MLSPTVEGMLVHTAHVLLAGKFDSAKKTMHVEKVIPAAQ